MTNKIETVNAAQSADERDDSGSVNVSFVASLGAGKIDLEQLLVPIQQKKVAPQQVSGLLRQAYSRLQVLRSNLRELEQLVQADSELVELVVSAGTALQPQSGFSLQTASECLESVLDKAQAQSTSADLLSLVRGSLALAAAAGQDYLTAEQRYAEAAETPELDSGLQWQYQIDRALALEDAGREFGDNAALQQAITLLDEQILDLVPLADQPQEWATTKHILGTVRGVLGQRQSGTRNLEDAIVAFNQSLEVRDRQTEPLQWAATQNSLGNALGILAHRQKDEEMLDQSIVAFELALEERTREVTAQDWATTRNNLAAVLQSVGQRKKDTKILKRSVESYKEVLQEWTREKVPLDWATTMNNMGTALRLLGEHRKGPRTLEQSVAAYSSALAERTREQFPQEWAMTQNNLGAAYHRLGEREESPDALDNAIGAYESALLEWTREHVPMTWGMTVANLAVARRVFAELTGDVESARKAVNEMQEVTDVFRHASHAHYSELSIDQLAKARKTLSAIESA